MLTEQQVDIINRVSPGEIAATLVERLPDEAQLLIEAGPAAINADYVPVIAECLQAIVASTIAILIDAGSERDAVMENDELRQALEAELAGWQWPVIWPMTGS